MPNPDPLQTDPAGEAVLAALEGRRSIRAFLPDPVPPATLRRILTAAAGAPSGSNTQPWQVHVVTGATKTALEAELLAAHQAGGAGHVAEYAYYPEAWRDPYLARRRKVGWDLYSTLKIARADKARMAAQMGRNYILFGAPLGLMFAIDRDLGRGSWLDHGFFLQGIATAARAYGLDTCPQAAFTPPRARPPAWDIARPGRRGAGVARPGLPGPGLTPAFGGSRRSRHPASLNPAMVRHVNTE